MATHQEQLKEIEDRIAKMGGIEALAELAFERQKTLDDGGFPTDWQEQGDRLINLDLADLGDQYPPAQALLDKYEAAEGVVSQRITVKYLLDEIKDPKALARDAIGLNGKAAAKKSRTHVELLEKYQDHPQIKPLSDAFERAMVEVEAELKPANIERLSKMNMGTLARLASGQLGKQSIEGAKADVVLLESLKDEPALAGKWEELRGELKEALKPKPLSIREEVLARRAAAQNNDDKRER